jgi:tetratricopeptide (TPR) repeat protein
VPAPLVGRGQELARLEQHLAGEGTPVLLLAGEPGIGKSRLLQEAAQEAREQGWVVLEGGCHPRSSQNPYAPVLSALERRLHRGPAPQLKRELEGCAWLGRLLPELVERGWVAEPSWMLPPEQERRLLFAGVARYLGNIAGAAGTLLVLDDLHWAGSDALDLLRSLLGTPDETPVRLVGAYRSTEVRTADPLGVLVAEWARAGLVSQNHLGALGASEARALLDSLLADEEPIAASVREQVLARTGGVPYFLVNCAQALCVPGSVGNDQSIPWDVAESIRQRAAVLPQVAQDILSIAAIAGSRVPRRLLVKVAGAGGQRQREVLAALEAASQARLLVEDGSAGYAFPHSLIHDVLLHDLSAARREMLHQQVAEALEQLPPRLREGRAAELAWHWGEAGEAERALPWALLAGKQAEAIYAHQEAERHYQAASELAGEVGDQRQEAAARERLGVVQGHQARYEQAQEQLEAALARYQVTGDVEGQGRALAWLGRVHGVHGNPRTRARGVAWIVSRLESLAASGLSLSGQATLFLVLAQLYNYAQAFAEALAAAEQAVALAQQASDDRLLYEAQMRWGSALLGRERQGEGMAVLEEVIPKLEATGDLEELRTALFNLAWAYQLWGDFEHARRTNDRAVEIAERVGDLQGIALATLRQAELAFRLGEWRQVRLACDRARSLTQHEGGLSYYTGFLLLQLGILSLAEGQTEAASHTLHQALDLAERVGATRMLLIMVSSVLAEWDLLAGRSETAYARLEALHTHSESVRAEEVPRLAMLPRLAQSYAEQGAYEQAEALLTDALTQATALRRRFTVMEVRRTQGLLALRQERWQEAGQALEEALALCQAMHTPYEEAKTRYYFGVLHRAGGKPTEARDCWEAALAILNRLGERLYAAQVEQKLAGLEC